MENIDWLGRKLKMEFEDINEQDSQAITYFNKLMERQENGSLVLSIDQLVSEVTKEIQSTVTTPATNNLYKVDPLSPLLNEKEKARLHTIVAKLLYLAMRTCPDILFPIAFLTTRVIMSTKQNELKLCRVLMYLDSTRDKI